MGLFHYDIQIDGLVTSDAGKRRHLTPHDQGVTPDFLRDERTNLTFPTELKPDGPPPATRPKVERLTVSTEPVGLPSLCGPQFCLRDRDGSRESGYRCTCQTRHINDHT